MKEKELRLALVCYGGVSLAVYMHGVTKEIQKLVRASRMYHSVSDPTVRLTKSYRDLNDDTDRETDTEEIYFDLLREIGKDIELRVFVDVIAGASAGGINGVMLARALAHDLPLDKLRQMWLEIADITKLMDEDTIAGRWSKAFIKPLFWNINRRWLTRLVPDAEMRLKLSTFLRSRWFKPPFSGPRMSGMMLDAAASMGEPRSPTASLLPLGHKLDLFVSVTDFFGYAQNIPLHDPPSIKEREHRHVLHFSYLKHANGPIDTDFDAANIPALAFAARATSSFPGAFPATQINEIDRVLIERGEDWPAREDFLAKNFKPLIEAGSNPLTASFIDGSVLNNHPFGEAIGALRGRSAFREVDRRIVYIDPDPEGGGTEHSGSAPGFFQTLRGALSDLPRNQPIRDELEDIHGFAERVRRYRQVVTATRGHIAARVRDLVGHELDVPLGEGALAMWRDKANARAALEAGYAYDGYVQLKVVSVLDRLTDLLANLSGTVRHPRERLKLARAVETWALEKEIFPVRWSTLQDGGAGPSVTTVWVNFLREFDINFRRRRLRFVIRRLNELYEEAAQGRAMPFDTQALDEFKATLYEALDGLDRRLEASRYGGEIAELARSPQCREGSPPPAFLDRLFGLLAPEMDLIRTDGEVDEIFSIMTLNYLPPDARAELMQAYLGFPFFDVITFPLIKWQDLDDLDTIRVDRISPEDARAIRSGAKRTLKGRELSHFAAFFSRSARENDYLWGRLHSADRLVDIVMSSVRPSGPTPTADVVALKHRLFKAILAAEKPHLPSCAPLIDDLERELGGETA